MRINSHVVKPFIILCCSFLLACSGPSSSPPDAALADGRIVSDGRSVSDLEVTSLSEICDRQAELLCAPVVTCCQDIAPAAADVNGCKAALLRVCLSQGEEQAEALEQGTARINVQGLVACETLGKAAVESCRLPTEPDEIETCSNTILSVAEVGQTCASQLSGGRCAAGEGICFAEPTGFPCKAWAEQGTLCSVAPCAPGLICMHDPDPSKKAICDKPRGTGEVCVADRHCATGLACFDNECATALAQGADCKDSGSKCLPELMCDLLTSTCAPRLAENESCYLASQCKDGLSCTEVTTGLVCIPGSPSDGSDEAGVPTLGQKCTTLCAKGLKCADGPVPGACIPSLCFAVLQALVP
jgi:hypothetical protein